MRSFNDMKMFTKIFVLVAVVITVIALPIFTLVMPRVKAQIREDKEAQLRYLTQSVYTAIEGHYKAYQAGLMSEEGAKKAVVNLIKMIRYEGDNYFWINDSFPRMIVHPIKPELDGKDQTDYKDPNGKQLFVEFAKVCKQSGEGFVDYEWPKPGFSKPQPKISYVKLFKEWDWIVGTGVYVDDMKAVIAKLQWYVVGIVVGGLLIALLVSYIVGRKVVQPILKMVDMIKDVAEGEGDLSKRLELDSKDELGELAKWFNVFIEKLHDIIAQIANTTVQAAAAGEQASASSEELASGAEEQQAQTTQVATSVEEMSATIQEVAKNANEAANSSKSSGEAAKKGGEIVQKTVEGIMRISDSSKATAEAIKVLTKNSEQIGSIIGVIDDVADQTNLLALNAAIEAARAGEQGRGFAVVADEVRKLAERTSSSTKEITGMVKTMQEGTQMASQAMERGMKDVDGGVKLAEQAGNTLKEIVVTAQHVVDLVQQVATAAEEQSAAAEEISSNVESVASVAKQTAVGTQQISEASQEVAKLADGLQSLVNKFKLKAGSVKQAERREHVKHDYKVSSSAPAHAVPAPKKPVVAHEKKA
ncbi:MAG TPA: methyl-accepting chemotaxis protein [Elusimicrobiota bacterium]|nr:methyl-accepting chemotaxis protein [Elusimicrobiota bacterium]